MSLRVGTSKMAMVGNDIHEYAHGRFRVRVYRDHVRHYLGMFPTYDDALLARTEFLLNPEPYTKLWFELQSRKQRLDFVSRYSNKK